MIVRDPQFHAVLDFLLCFLLFHTHELLNTAMTVKFLIIGVYENMERLSARQFASLI